MTIRLAFITLSLCALTALGCSKTRRQTGTDGATHFLRACDASTDCGPLACLCGVCSRSCEGEGQCTGLSADAQCLAPSASSCGASKLSCALECEDDGECDTIGGDARCEAGRCVRPAASLADDAGSGSSAGKGGSAGPAGAGGASGSGVTSGGPGDASVSSCAAMDAVWDGTECLRKLGYTWDGRACTHIECGCDGADCDALYPTLGACEDARRGCATPCRSMDARSDGTKCAGIAGYSWNGISCDEVVCGCTGSDCSSIYASESECETAHDGCARLTTCSGPADCTLGRKDCCGCEMNPLDLVAISVFRTREFADRVCENRACPDCAMDPLAPAPPRPPRYLPQCVLATRWRGFQCQLLDVARLACTPEVGCRVRARTCCECNADVAIENLMAVPNGDDVARTALCEPGEACDGCLPIYPDNVVARCGDSGFCELLADDVVITL